MKKIYKKLLAAGLGAALALSVAACGTNKETAKMKCTLLTGCPVKRVHFKAAPFLHFIFLWAFFPLPMPC